nr:AMP-binding protein [uncultured Carboxylicivirga sp.]
MNKKSIHKQYTSFHFNHVLYQGEQSIKLLAQQLCVSAEDWEKAIGVFLSDWMKDDADIELYTSGSTGRPKNITMPKSSMVYSAQRTIEFFHLKPEDKALLCLSANYIAGKMMIVRALVGRLHVIANSVSSDPLKELNEQIDFAALVPAQAKVSFQNSRKQFDLVKTIILGGAKVDDDLSKCMQEVTTECWETYGMTETVSHIALRKISGGKMNPFTLLNEISVTINDKSCLVIAPSDINTKELITNDVVELLDEGHFLLKGRHDNVINSGGIKIQAEEVEAKLKPFFESEIVVVGLPDEKWGEAVVLVVETTGVIENDEVISESISKYEKPKHIYCIEEFPRTESGKVQRGEIKEIVLNIKNRKNA